MTKSLSAREVVRSLRPGMTVFLPGSSGEPVAFLDALKQEPENAAGVRFITSFLPNFNPEPLAGLAEGTEHICFFPQARRIGDAAEQQLPLSYTGIATYLNRLAKIDLTIAQTTVFAADNTVSLGPSAEFTTLAAAKSHSIIAFMNRQCPRPAFAPTFPASSLSSVVECDQALRRHEMGTIGDDGLTIVTQIMSLIPADGVLQIGVGKLPALLCRALLQRADVRLHTGIVFDEGLDLAEQTYAHTGHPSRTGLAIGTEILYRRLQGNPALHISPVTETHFPAAIAQHETFVAMNSALEIDLYGQVNSEMVNGRWISGTGGASDFVRGAIMARNGCSIIALPAVSGGQSRIVSRLSPHHPATLSRHEADIFVTEFGIARVRDLPPRQRAEAIASIAAPEFRASLLKAWEKDA